VKWEESKEEIKEMGKKSKHSYQYDLVKRGGNSAVMEAKKTIAARFYQHQSGHALIAKYLLRIGKRRDMNCTGKNDLTRRVTHREAVSGTVIHSIFDA